MKKFDGEVLMESDSLNSTEEIVEIESDDDDTVEIESDSKELQSFRTELKQSHFLTAVREDLDAAVVFDSGDEAETSGFQTQIDEISIRICNAYGSQKSNLTDAIKLNFWQQLEKQNISAVDVKCETVIDVGPGQKKTFGSY